MQKVELKKENNCLLSSNLVVIAAIFQAVFEVSMQALKLKWLEGRIEAVNCVCGRQLFGRFQIRSEFFVFGQGGHCDSSQLHDPPQDTERNGRQG